MTDSRKILIDVVFAKDSLSKISSADMREFVNYVYDELMNKNNIADNLTNTSFSTALSAKQGVILDSKITDISKSVQASKLDITKNTDEISKTNNSLSTAESDIIQVVKDSADNATNIQNNQVGIAKLEVDMTTQKILSGSLDTKITKNKDDISTITIDISKNTADIQDLYNKLATAIDLTQIEADIQANKTEINNVKVSLDPIKNNITDIDTKTTRDIQVISNKVDTFRGDIDTNTNGLQTTNTNLTSSMVAIAAQANRITVVENDVSNIKQDANNLISLQTQVRDNEIRSITNSSDIVTIFDKTKQNATSIHGMNTEIRNHNAKLSNLESRTHHNKQDIANNIAGLNAVQKVSTASANKIVQITSDHVTMGTDISNIQSSISTAGGGIIDVNKRVDQNAQAITTNRDEINKSNAEIIKNMGHIADNAAYIQANEANITKNTTDIILHETDINQSQRDIQALQTGFTFPGLMTKKTKDQIVISTDGNPTANLSISARDQNNTTKWSIGTISGYTLNDLVIKSDKVIFDTPVGATITRTDGTDTFDIVETIQPSDDQSMLIWELQSKSWLPYKVSDIITNLNLATISYTTAAINTKVTDEITDFDVNTLQVGYYNKQDADDKISIDLGTKVANTDLSEYGSSDSVVLGWDKLINFTPQQKLQKLSSSTASDLSSAISEINTLKAKVIELMEALEGAKVFV